MATISYKQTSHAVLNVLKKYTDEEHRIKQQEIIELVRQETGKIHVRKSIRKDLNELIAVGYPIRYHKGWYYEHEFCPAELNLIVDSLRTAAGITASQRDELIRKISRLGGEWYAKDENNRQLRPKNPQFLYVLDVLHEAINAGKKVLFYYGNYGIDKQLHYRCRDDGQPRDYLINPYHILTTNGRYYLVCNVDKYDTIAHFRIERIMDIQITDQPVKAISMIEGCENGIDIQRYVNDHPYMYNGKPKKHTFMAKAAALNDVFDWFGMESKIEPMNDDEIKVTVKADDVSFDYWCRRYAEHMLEMPEHDSDQDGEPTPGEG